MPGAFDVTRVVPLALQVEQKLTIAPPKLRPTNHQNPLKWELNWYQFGLNFGIVGHPAVYF